ncbi:ATP-binding protein [Colwellia sp. RSH04]|uniref:ATP-binding protein n=1 Tax=Colwellia sp. RSH04 TaxID=2305464 RepID=UPI0028704544|nr:ATP-binding protein [Colwellia sp. RSH04]
MLNIPIHSLKLRMLASASIIVLVLLPAIGIVLTKSFENRLVNALEKELSAYSYSILAVTEVENNAVYMPEQLTENLFNVSGSGLYSVITAAKNNVFHNKNYVLWQSNSLLTVELPIIESSPKVGESKFSTLMINEQAHFIYSFSVSFTSNGDDSELVDFPVTLHLIKDKNEFNDAIDQFTQSLWLWLFLLMSFIAFMQWFWLRWMFKPLQQLKEEVHEIEQGNISSLEKEYPTELHPLTKQVNLLLKTEQNQRTRYRNALSDLAHSLKTPLAVIQSHDDITHSTKEQLDIINNMIEHQLKRAQSAGEVSWHKAITINAVLQKLISTLSKIYADKNITFKLDCQSSASFRGDESDLLEMLGNLLDNACKACNSSVAVSVKRDTLKLSINIEDDGKGIDTELREQIFKRGVRIDSYQQGHGIGLAIVRDLVSSYQGQLLISTSEKLSGAKFILQFDSQKA